MEEKKELLRIEHLTVSFAQYEKRSAKQGVRSSRSSGAADREKAFWRMP